MKKLLLWTAGIAAAAILVPVVWVLLTLSNLPDVSVLKRYRPAVASEALDRNGDVIAQFYDRVYRVWAPIPSLPDHVIQAVVTAEDDTFFEHQGVNYKAVWDALRHDMEKKRFARGGSTITQQMIKNVLLTKEKTVTRKLREFVLARRAEEVLTKRQILEIYLNEVEWGDRLYGIEAASRFYFDRHAAELTKAQAALLAGMLPNPRYYNPFKRPDKARQRQEQVLFNMFQAKLLTEEEYAAAMEEPLRLRAASSPRFDLSMLEGSGGRSCHQKVLEEALLRISGETALYRQGLKFRTTLDRTLQNGIAALASGGTVVEEAPDRVLVVKEGREIRAVSCALNEEKVREYLAQPAINSPAYDLSVVDPDDITKEEILQPSGENVPKPAGDGSSEGK
jgi:monofunctional biosynthetic peptidoglycan transglycosylase